MRGIERLTYYLDDYNVPIVDEPSLEQATNYTHSLIRDELLAGIYHSDGNGIDGYR